MSDLPPHWRRAAANALWPRLRRRAWTPHKHKTTYHPTGNPRSSTYPQPHFPQQLPNSEVIASHPYMLAYVWPEDWPARIALRVELLEEDHDRVISSLAPEAQAEYEAARDTSNARLVFHAKVNRHGSPILRRNSEDGAITATVAHTLELIAEAATVDVIPQPVVDALIGESDDVTAELVSLPAIQASVQRGAEH